MMDPQQEIFTAFRVGLEELYPGRIYDGPLPPEGTPYPFIYLADTSSVDTRPAKDALFADVSIRIHIWHSNLHRRGDLSAMLLDVKRFGYALQETASAFWDPKADSQNILPDTTTDQPLLHGVLDFSYRMRGLKCL